MLYPLVNKIFEIFFFIGASAKKYCIRSQILRYGMPKDFLSKWQKKAKRDERTCSMFSYLILFTGGTGSGYFKARIRFFLTVGSGSILVFSWKSQGSFTRKIGSDPNFCTAGSGFFLKDSIPGFYTAQTKRFQKVAICSIWTVCPCLIRKI